LMKRNEATKPMTAVANECRDHCADKYSEKIAYCNSLPHSQFRACKEDAQLARTECKGECNEK